MLLGHDKNMKGFYV